MDISKQQATRNLFLMKLYEITGGDRWTNPVMYEIGRYLNLDNNETDRITDYLSQKGYITILTKQRFISITAEGIDKAEDLFNNNNNKSYSKDETSDILEKILESQVKNVHTQDKIYNLLLDLSKNNSKIQKKDIKLMIINMISNIPMNLDKVATFFFGIS